MVDDNNTVVKTPVHSSSPKKNKTYITTIIIFSIICLLALLFVMYVYFSENKKNNKVSNSNSMDKNNETEISIELNKGTHVDIYNNPMYEESRQSSFRQSSSRVVNNQIYEGVEN